MSFTDPAPTELASQHMPKTKCPGTAQTRPRTSRLLQLQPSTPGTSRPPPETVWITPDTSGIIWSSTGTPCCTWKTWKSLAILENCPEHPAHRAGATIMAHTLPLDMWHMYVTTPPVRLHQRHPVGLPSSGSGGQSKWYTLGAEDSKLNQIIPRKPRENCLEHPRLTWNKPDSTGRNSTSPKCAPGTHLPLGEPVNHDYRIEHQRAPLSH